MAVVNQQAKKSQAKKSTTARITEQSPQRLRKLAAQTGEPMQAILDKALEEYRRQKFWKELDVAYAALASDPKAMAEYQAELAIGTAHCWTV